MNHPYLPCWIWSLAHKALFPSHRFEVAPGLKWPHMEKVQLSARFLCLLPLIRQTVLSNSCGPVCSLVSLVFTAIGIYYLLSYRLSLKLAAYSVLYLTAGGRRARWVIGQLNHTTMSFGCNLVFDKRGWVFSATVFPRCQNVSDKLTMCSGFNDSNLPDTLTFLDNPDQDEPTFLYSSLNY